MRNVYAVIKVLKACLTGFLIAETEERFELDEYGKPLPKATDLVSINKVLEFRARCLDLLGSTIVLKDNFDEYGGNGLEALPSCVRDLVLPLIQARLHRPYILQGGDKLLIVPTSPQDVGGRGALGVRWAPHATGDPEPQSNHEMGHVKTARLCRQAKAF